VQAARQWRKKFKSTIMAMGYQPSQADPCLFFKNNGKSISFILIYVDDGGIFGKEEEIKYVLTELAKTFKVKDLGKLENFIGCRLIDNQSKDTIWIHQPKLLKHLKQAFGDMVKDVREYTTPAAPKTSIMRPQEGDLLFSAERQKTFLIWCGYALISS
jgi:Reverse transcriptase (RNA-dependent DNA polymerase)